MSQRNSSQILKETEMRMFIMALLVAKYRKQHRRSTLDLSKRGLCSGPCTSEDFTYHKGTEGIFVEIHMGTLVTSLVLRTGMA